MTKSTTTRYYKKMDIKNKLKSNSVLMQPKLKSQKGKETFAVQPNLKQKIK